MQHTATRCNTLRHTATHCNTLLFDRPTNRSHSMKPKALFKNPVYIYICIFKYIHIYIYIRLPNYRLLSSEEHITTPKNATNTYRHTQIQTQTHTHTTNTYTHTQIHTHKHTHMGEVAKLSIITPP